MGPADVITEVIVFPSSMIRSLPAIPVAQVTVAVQSELTLIVPAIRPDVIWPPTLLYEKLDIAPSTSIASMPRLAAGTGNTELLGPGMSTVPCAATAHVPTTISCVQ